MDRPHADQSIDLYNAQRSLLVDLKRHWLAARVTTTAYRWLRRMALTYDGSQPGHRWLAASR